MQNLPRISKQFQLMQRIPTKKPTVQNRALTVQTPIFRGYIAKKNVKSYDLTFNI